MDPIGILIITYNRPESLKRTVASLLKCKSAPYWPIIVSVDGPKSQDDRFQQQEIAKFVEMWEHPSRLQLRTHPSNLGLAQHVTSAIDYGFTQFEYLVILEDDLEFHPDFLLRMKEANTYYKDTSTIGSVHAFTFSNTKWKQWTLAKEPANLGWGTWKRAWQNFNPDAENHIRFFEANNAARTEFDKNNAYPYFGLLHKHFAGTISSWAVLWYASMYRNKLLTLQPPQSLVKTHGQGENATHCHDSIPWNIPIASDSLPLNSDYSSLIQLTTDTLHDFYQDVFDIPGYHMSYLEHQKWLQTMIKLYPTAMFYGFQDAFSDKRGFQIIDIKYRNLRSKYPYLSFSKPPSEKTPPPPILVITSQTHYKEIIDQLPEHWKSGNTKIYSTKC